MQIYFLKVKLEVNLLIFNLKSLFQIERAKVQFFSFSPVIILKFLKKKKNPVVEHSQYSLRHRIKDVSFWLILKQGFLVEISSYPL
jgi:hypothetical protein